MSEKLPHSLSRFIGRQREQKAVNKLLKQHRLVTLTGPGGIGKTRLATAVAAAAPAQYPDGIFFVDLAAVDDEHQLE